jgi:L-aminopeptidase/D-esterase-like protein
MTEYSRREFAESLAVGMAGTGLRRSARLDFQTAARDTRTGSLTDVPGISVGHATETRRPTGCTAILFDQAVAAGADYSSSAPAESMGVLLQPVSPVERIHAIFLTGGGMFGIAAAGGVVRFLEDHKVGFDWGTPDLRIPIVVTGAIDDLALGDARIRPDADAAYRACAAATTGPVAEGSVGAGTGATVGKMHLARGYAGMKGGIGSASLKIGDVVIGALAVVNAAGDVLDWRSGRIVAGARRKDGTLADSVDIMRTLIGGPSAGAVQDPPLGSTTIVVVATNVDLPKTALTKIASMANCGGARAVRPYHTTGDGDQLLAISTRKVEKPDVQLTVLGALAADVVADAIVRAVRTAKGVPGWPGLSSP